MNKEICINTINIVNNFRDTQTNYSNYISNVREQETLSSDDFSDIKEVARKRLSEIQKLKEELSSLKGKISPSSYDNLMSSIENEEALVSMLGSDAEQFLETQDRKYSDSVLTGLKLEKETENAITESLYGLEKQIEIYMIGASLSHQISLEDVKEITNSLEKGTSLHMKAEILIGHLERMKAKEEKKENVEQQKKEETTTQFVSEPAPMQPLKGPLPPPTEPTLEQKISGVSYSKNGNMVAEVQEITIEDRMAQIAAEISKLAGKEKLTLREMITIKTLQEEQFELEAYAETLSKQKLSRSEMKRNKKMQQATERLQENRELLEQARENSKGYNSKIMRFVSARYQEQLETKILNLYNKRGVVQDKQRASAVAKYNKVSGKITRKSHVLGTVRGMTQFTNAKIEELKAFRDQIVGEVTALSQDAKRFFSSREMIPDLKQKKIVKIDEILSVEEHTRGLQAQAKSA